MSTSHHPHDPHSLGAHSLPPPGPHLPPPQGQRFLMNEPGSELQIPSRDGFPSGYLMLSPQRKQCVASGDLGPPCASPLSWGSHLPLDLSLLLSQTPGFPRSPQPSVSHPLLLSSSLRISRTLHSKPRAPAVVPSLPPTWKAHTPVKHVPHLSASGRQRRHLDSAPRPKIK